MRPPLESVLGAVLHAEKLLQAPHPEALEESAGLLEAATRALAAEADRARCAGAGGVELLPAAMDLRRAVGRAVRLLQNASDYHRRWAQWKGSMAGGYDQGGRAAECVSCGSVSVRG